MRGVLVGAVVVVVLAMVAVLLVRRELGSRPAVDRLAFIKERVRKHFPDAPQISTATLASRLAVGEQIVLLDVRSPAEFEVSHLRGAIRVDPTDHDRALPAEVRAGAKVVAYCSVGWRSSELVEKLRLSGIEAENLEGSIFQWVAEDRPVYRGDEPVAVVHPYSPAWAWLVDPHRRGPVG